GQSGETIDPTLLESLLGGAGGGPAASAGWVLRWISYLAGLIAAGAALFQVRLLRDPVASVTALIRWAVLAGILASLFQIPVFAAEATGLGWGALTSGPALREAVFSSVGLAALVRVVALVVILIGHQLGPVVLAWFGVVGVVVAEMLTGHTRTTDPAYLITASAAVH